jgi:hypothetical protein
MTLALAVASPAFAAHPPKPSTVQFNDSPFHLTNDVQEGIDARVFLKIMETRSECGGGEEVAVVFLEASARGPEKSVVLGEHVTRGKT